MGYGVVIPSPELTKMIADWMTTVSTVLAASPVSLAGAALAAGCLGLYVVMRAPEFLVAAGSAVCYAAVATLNVLHG